LQSGRWEALAMGLGTGKWNRIASMTVAASLSAAAFASAQFTSFNDRSRLGLEGNWQSCRDGGEYAERVYDGRWPGLPPFELHLGPYHDFALFLGLQDEHRDHNSAANLLNPHVVELRSNRAAQKWDVAQLHLEVALSGGSREECESWYVRLMPATSSSN
jgi:hypothetical protein